MTVCVCVCFRLASVVTSWSCQCSTKEAFWWPTSTWLLESSHRSSCTPSGWASVSQVTATLTMPACTLSYHLNLSFCSCVHLLALSVWLLIVWRFSVWCVGLSSFYSELMKGFGAGARLWELLDRKPEFPLNGGYTYTCSHRQESITSEYPLLSHKHIINFLQWFMYQEKKKICVEL